MPSRTVVNVRWKDSSGSRWVASRRNDPDAAIRAYEEAMFARILPIAEMSARVQRMMLSPTAADDLVRFFQPVSTNRTSRSRG